MINRSCFSDGSHRPEVISRQTSRFSRHLLDPLCQLDGLGQDASMGQANDIQGLIAAISDLESRLHDARTRLAAASNGQAPLFERW